MKTRMTLWGFALCMAASVAVAQPNIVVILTDDQGYADISLNPHHPKEVSTPHMDALAADGVVFSQAYTSGQVCSPTRAGLMLGRYQQRVGVYSAGDGGRGFDPKLPIFPGFLPETYRSTAIGKWHLGLDADFPELKWHAMHRGFGECYKFMGRGGHSYFDLRSDSTGKFAHPIYRNKERINDKGYLTNRLTEEAVAFIDRNKAQPFFLYLAYNAVHAPPEAPETDIEEFRQRFPGISDKRAILMAMLRHLDNGVGEVVSKLKKEGLFENTILFFLTDNGGAKAMSANNTPLRGFKGSLYEGGIRTPFIVSWPKRFSGGRTVDTPVVSLDILPTALDAIGAASPDKSGFDGKSLLPLLTGDGKTHHDTLYWSEGGKSGEWAVRRGDWKLHANKEKLSLFNLAEDPSEETNLAAGQLDRVKDLGGAFDGWIEQMADPITGDDKRWSKKTPGEESAREKSRAERRAKKRAERRMQRKKKGGVPPSAPVKPKNVLFLVCDDLNTHVSTSGYPHIKTPSFDQLAAAGMTFSRAYCQYPVCGPSRASFLHGLYPQSTGVLNNKADIRETRSGTVSLPQGFKTAGYWTGAVGKVFHNAKIDPGEVAWDEVLRFQNDELPMVTPAREAFEKEHGPINKGKTRRLWKEKVQTLGTQTRGQKQPAYGRSGLRDEQHRDGKNARQIVSWLENKTNGDKPFFMACGIHKPHVPFLAPDKYFDQYPKEGLRVVPAPPDFWSQAPRMAMVKRYEGFGFELGVENDALRREYMQAYHACISFIDTQIGLIFDALKRTGHWDDTIVILTSDHGYQLGEHFMWGKVTLFEVCARVPLVMRVPGRTAPGSSSTGLVELVDLYPTLAALCDVAAPDDLQGRSLVPMLDDPATGGKDAVYTVVTRRQELGKAIRTPRWRYTAWPRGEELYDLRDDPAEHRNLADSSQHSEILQVMRAHLRRVDATAVGAKR
ncbi:MAG: sulfatase-like hydrolase/transferase [Planctomycetes bacterium]|nr:sulfatase-like hydrolase/transferase [Planctomycetota bacterium]